LFSDFAEITEHCDCAKEIILHKEPKFLNTIPATDYVIGRTNFLEELHKSILQNNTLMLVNGIGGIGKTTIATAYVNDPKFNANFDFIAWFTVENC
jgi:Tfp pilus assembly pilus retraction ATPase PilT